MGETSLLQQLTRHPVRWTSIIVLVWLIGVALLRGTFGQIGPDNDDLMRLVQVRDLLAGQSWFDLTQNRLGSNGTLMHWSRLVDLPLAALMGLFGLISTPETAERLAIGIWPPLTALPLIAGTLYGAKRLGDDAGIAFTAILLVVLLTQHYRFEPGAIDHHNVQFALLGCALGLCADRKAPGLMFGFAGLAVALSVGIGVEVYFFIAVFCGAVAMCWMLWGETYRDQAMGFSAGLVAGALGIFFLTIAPAQYGVVACDAFSLITMLLAVIGGGGLFVAAAVASAKSLSVRFAAMALVGLAGVACMALQAPQCLASPLSNLGPMVTELWLNRVREAISLFALGDMFWTQGMFVLGPQLTALVVLLLMAWRRLWPSLVAIALPLMITSVVLTIVQVRFGYFGAIFAILPMGLWIGAVFAKGRREKEGSVAYILPLVLALPFAWAAPGVLFSGDDPAQLAQSETCTSEQAIGHLTPLPQGMVLATTNMSPVILAETEHAVLTGNYHRNLTGITAALQIVTSRPDQAREMLKQQQIDYALFCIEPGEDAATTAYAPEGMLARLQAGETLDGTSAIKTPDEDDNWLLLRVDE